MHPLKALKKGMRKKLQRGGTPSDCISLATASSVSLVRTPRLTRRRLVRSISDVKQLYRRSVCFEVEKTPLDVSLDTLCDPLLLRILKKLDPRDVLALRLVSKPMSNFVQRYSNELSKVDLGKLCLIGTTDGGVVRYSARTLHSTNVASEALQVKHIERALQQATCNSLVLEFLVIDTGLISALAKGLTCAVAELEIAQCYVNCSSTKLADQLHKWNVVDLVLKECTFMCPRNDSLSPISDRLFQRNHQLRHVSCTYKHRAWSNLSDDTLCMWAVKCSWPDNMNLCNFRSNVTHYGIYVVAKAFITHSLQFPADEATLLWNLGTIESTPFQLRAQLEKLRRFVDITEETTTFTSLRVQATPSQSLHLHVSFRKRTSEVLNCSLNTTMFSVFSSVSKSIHV